jgi:hypothetical protein
MTTIASGRSRSAGARTRSANARNTAVIVAAATLVHPGPPSSASAPMTVSPSQRPWGSVPSVRYPRAARPWGRAIRVSIPSTASLSSVDEDQPPGIDPGHLGAPRLPRLGHVLATPLGGPERLFFRTRPSAWGAPAPPTGTRPLPCGFGPRRPSPRATLSQPGSVRPPARTVPPRGLGLAVFAALVRGERPLPQVDGLVFDPAVWWHDGPPCWEASAMGQVLHGSARTTEAVRRAIRLRQEGVRAPARRFDVSPTTVQRRRRRETAAGAETGPKEARSTVLAPEEEAIVVAFRRHTLVPLDDRLHALQPTIPRLMRSALHRRLQRHGTGRSPEVDGDRPGKKRSASYLIGYFHIGIAGVSTDEGRLRLFVAIDRAGRFAFARLVERACKMGAARFLRELVEAAPYRIHTALADNGVRFAPRKQDVWDGRHILDRACDEPGIEHRLTRVDHPWTNGQVERVNRTPRDAAVKRYYHGSHDQLRARLRLFVGACDHARRLKTMRGLAPCGFIHQAWTREPERFRLDPSHHTPGPYS